MFHVGQKVVCIRNDFDTPSGVILPQSKCIYTLRTIEPGRVNPERTYVRLHEIVNHRRQCTFGIFEHSFNAEAFRPVIERKTDISIFQQMLTPKPKVRERA